MPRGNLLPTQFGRACIGAYNRYSFRQHAVIAYTASAFVVHTSVRIVRKRDDYVGHLS